MRILFIGDIVGKGGRKTCARLVPEIRKKEHIDVVIANAENIAHGVGITRKTLRDLQDAQIDAFTSGNHITAKPEGIELLKEKELRLLRPHNMEHLPGSGMMHIPVGKYTLTVLNLEGRVFMNEDNVANPFHAVNDLLEHPDIKHTNAILVDFHAEATSEKVAFGWHLDGRVSAVVGTHTHVATADARMLNKGTAYVTDVGMTGPRDSVIGVDTDVILTNFLEDSHKRHDIPESGIMKFNGVIIDIDPSTQRASTIRRFDQHVEI